MIHGGPEGAERVEGATKPTRGPLHFNLQVPRPHIQYLVQDTATLDLFLRVAQQGCADSHKQRLFLIKIFSNMLDVSLPATVPFPRHQSDGTGRDLYMACLDR